MVNMNMDIDESENNSHAQNDDNSAVKCKLCDKILESRNKFMLHKKHEHTENVPVCLNFINGDCERGDTGCWFIHSNITHNPEICKVCDKIFKTKKDLRYHKKKEHIQNVQVCSYGNTCWYGERCWFRHNINEVRDNEENSNDEMTQKLFKMMEKFTKRIIELENRLKYINNME